MKIQRSVWERIVRSVPRGYAECGGLLGGRDHIVSTYVLDMGHSEMTMQDVYVPDTAFLNLVLRGWQRKGIELLGFFHTHLSGNERLSKGDIRYIQRIMRARHQTTDSLYFPIVLPGEKMIVYRADKKSKSVCIVSDSIELL